MIYVSKLKASFKAIYTPNNIYVYTNAHAHNVASDKKFNYLTFNLLLLFNKYKTEEQIIELYFLWLENKKMSMV